MKKQITRDGWCVNGQFHRLKILITDVMKHTLILIDHFIIHFVSIVMTIVSLSLSPSLVRSLSPLDHQQGTVHEQYFFSSWCINPIGCALTQMKHMWNECKSFRKETKRADSSHMTKIGLLDWPRQKRRRETIPAWQALQLPGNCLISMPTTECRYGHAECLSNTLKTRSEERERRNDDSAGLYSLCFIVRKAFVERLLNSDFFWSFDEFD